MRNLGTDEMIKLKCMSREMILQMLTALVCLTTEVSDKLLWIYMNTVKIFDNIYSYESPLLHFSPAPCSFSLLGASILLNTPFSKNLCPCINFTVLKCQ